MLVGDVPAVERSAAAWVGKWTGEASYTVAVVTSPVTGAVQRQEKTVSLALQVDEFLLDEGAEGWGVLVGRLAASQCVVSAAIHAMVFLGDSLSPVPSPLVSGSGGGIDHAGRMVGLTLNGDRRSDVIQGTLAFESESQRQAPCDSRELSFTLTRAP